MTHALRLRFSVFLISLAIALVLVGCGGSSAYSPPGQQGASLGGTVDAVVRAAMQQQGIPGMTVALAKKGTILYVQGYGVSDLTTRQATQPSVIFEIGSITKQFTAALIMKLQEQGQLHVDDSLATYLPEYNFSPIITLRMMLTHTSGLADFTNFPQLGDWVKHGVSEATVLCNSSRAHSTRIPTAIFLPLAQSSKSLPGNPTLLTSTSTSSARWG
jgi:CubicO group peptidase (beta-lactamase class C family)